jgi:iron complex outermembrane receptor protein
MAGTGLRQFFQGATKVKEFKDAKGNLKSTVEIIDILKKKLKGKGDADKYQLLTKMFDLRGAPVAMALLDQEDDALKSIMEDMRQQNSLQEKLNISMKGFNKQWDALKNNVKSVAADLYLPALNILKPFVEEANKVTDAELCDSIVYTLFPNFHPWGAYNRIVYRFRPYGNHHNMSIMECMILNPFKGKRPKAAPLKMLGVDDDWTDAFELGLLTRVFNQDVYNLPKVQEGLESGAIDGTSTTNDQALVDSMKVTPIREGTSKLSFVDAKISGELAKLAAGPLAYAVGTSFWREELTDTPDRLTQQGLVVGSIQQSDVNAARSAKALFGELAIPLPMQMEAQVAARYDSYPGASRTSPKAARLWRPSKTLMVRGSYTESFKMPRLKQLYGAQEQGAITLDTDEQCAAVGLDPGCGRPGYEVQGGNKELKPEKGKTWNLGLVYDVGPLSGTVDWWKIRIDNLIDQPTVTQALLAGKFSYDSIGNLLVYTNLQNFAVQESEGIDLDTRLRFPNVMGGTVTVKNTTTYYLNIKRKAAGGEWEYVLDTYHWPRVRNVLRVSYDTPAWSLTASHKLVGGFRDIDTFPTGTNPTPDDVRTVGKFEQVDISAAYKGFRNITLTGGIQNLLDRMPPISLQNASSNRYTQMGFAELYSSRGRFYNLTAEYKFK